jgi:hypothetical protein
MQTISRQKIVSFIFGLLLFPFFTFAQDADGDMASFRNRVNIDTVSKILNYTEGLEEGGTDNSFWYAYDSKACIYRRAGFVEAQTTDFAPESDKGFGLSNDSPSDRLVPINKTYTVFNPNIRELRLNSWAPSTVRIGYVNDVGTWWGPNIYFVQLIANGNLILQSTKPRDAERLKSAWDRVFTHFCPGVRNYF